MPAHGMPPMPAHLDKVGRETWKWLTAELAAMRILHRSDQAVITCYCDTWSDYVACRSAMKKASAKQRLAGMVADSDKGQKYIHTLSQLASMLKKSMMTYIRELGLSPTSRPGIEAMPPPADEEGNARFFPKLMG